MESGVWLCTTIYFFQQKNKAPTTCVVMRTGVELSKTSEENTRRISKFCLSFGLLSTSRGLRSPPRLPGCSAGRSTRGRRPRRSIPSSGMRSTCPATASATARTSSRLRRGHGGSRRTQMHRQASPFRFLKALWARTRSCGRRASTRACTRRTSRPLIT